MTAARAAEGRIGDYLLGEIAGEDAVGVVYRAVQQGLERTVHVKVVAPALAADEAFAERVRRDARVLAAVEHPHVIPVHHAAHDGGRLFVAMRATDTDLAAECAAAGERGAIDPQRALRIAAQVADALDAIHGQGLVHGDVKAANIALEQRPEGEHAFLTCLGAGAAAASASDPADADADSDRLAFACVLFAALTGTPPDLTAEHAPSAHALAPGLPATFDAVFARAFSDEETARFPTAKRFVEAAAAALTWPQAGAPTMSAGTATGGGPATVAATGSGGAASTAADEFPAPGHPRPSRRLGRRGRLAAALLAAAAAVASIGLLTRDVAPPSTPPATPFAAVARVEPVDLGAGVFARSLVADARRLYVADANEGRPGIVVVDTATRRRLRRIELPSRPVAMTLDPGRGRLWTTLYDGRVMSLNLADGAVRDAPFAVRGLRRPDQVLLVGDDLVAITYGTRVLDAEFETIPPARLARLDASLRRAVGPVLELPGEAGDALVHDGELLACVWDERTKRSALVRVSPRLRVISRRPIDGARRTVRMALDPAGVLWLTNRQDGADKGSVLRIDPRTGRAAAAPIALPSAGVRLAIDGASVWVTRNDRERVSRIDLKTGRLFEPGIDVDRLDGPVAARVGDGGGAWVRALDEVVAVLPADGAR